MAGVAVAAASAMAGVAVATGSAMAGVAVCGVWGLDTWTTVGVKGGV